MTGPPVPVAARRRGLSVRLKLTLSYAGFLMLAGVLLLTAAWVFLLRGSPGGLFVPDLFDLRLALDPRNFGAQAFLSAALLVLAALLVVGLAGGWFLAGRMLAPLTRLTEAARLAENGSLSHRIRLPGRTDEFRELADAFDGMLARLEEHVDEQERFAANASHELRTPLAITQALLDVARDDPAVDLGELVDRLQTVNTRAIDLTEALLLLGRADRRSLPREHVDLSLLAEEATEQLLPFAERHGVSIETAGDVCCTVGSRALLLQMVTNLVHNAVVHNLPGQGSVCVTTTPCPPAVVLYVENTGDRLDPDVVPTLVEPFQRGAARVRTGPPGVGLGLAIVKRITEAHDGTLTLAARPGGGLRVTAELPASPTHAHP